MVFNCANLEAAFGSGVGGLAGCLACHVFKSRTESPHPEALLRRCHNFYVRNPTSPRKKTIAKTAPDPAQSALIAAAFSPEFQVGLSEASERREACS